MNRYLPKPMKKPRAATRSTAIRRRAKVHGSPPTSSSRIWRSSGQRISAISISDMRLLVLCSLAVGPALLPAQADTIAPEMRSVDGKVLLGRRSGPVPVGRLWVVVHRIGPGRAGPLDSVRTSAAGKFDVRYRASGDASAMYIAVASYHGIAYITAPLRLPRVTGEDAQIMV